MVDNEHGRTGAPRWFKVFAALAVVIVVLVVVLLVVRGGHGPSRHSLADVDTGERAAPGIPFV